MLLPAIDRGASLFVAAWHIITEGVISCVGSRHVEAIILFFVVVAPTFMLLLAERDLRITSFIIATPAEPSRAEPGCGAAGGRRRGHYTLGVQLGRNRGLSNRLWRGD